MGDLVNVTQEIIPPVELEAHETAEAQLLPKPKKHTLFSDWSELVKLRLNFLVLVTTLIGYCAARATPTIDGAWWRVLLMTLLGSALSAAGAAALNEVWEIEPDKLMRRTADRPLPTGRIRRRTATVAGLLMATSGVGLLTIGANALTAGLSATTVLLYVLVYTPLKRVTTANTLVGAIPGAIPPVMGVTAATGAITWDAAALFALMFCWQIPHFLAIAILCRDEYKSAGFKMLPGSDPKLTRTAAWIVTFNVLLLAASLMPMSSLAARPAQLLYILASSVLGTVFLAAGVRCAWTRDRRDARVLFFVSIIYLPLLLTMILIDRL